MKRLLSILGAGALVVGLLLSGATAASAHGQRHDRDFDLHSKGHRSFHHSSKHHGHHNIKVTVVRPGESIQAAIDATDPGGAVFVKRGTYHEQLVITDGVKLIGDHATLAPPVSNPGPTPCSFGDPSVDGICIAGDFTADAEGNITVNSYVEGVVIAGFRIEDFEGSGVIQIGGKGTTFLGNVASGNGGYGLAAFDSNGTRFLFNTASGSEEAGLYVGDSHPADATLFANHVFDNGFGIFVRNAEQGHIVNNRANDNCLGILFLADAPGPDGAFGVFGNSISHNTKACPPNEEEGGPPISGVGIAILGAHDVTVKGNSIRDNVPSGPTFASGGVVVFTGLGGTPPANNRVQFNRLRDNQPDINWDGTGSGNVLQPNACETSTPADLCGGV